MILEEIFKSIMQKSGTFWKLISSVSLLLFEGFEGDAFFRSFFHESFKDGGSRNTVTTKMEIFWQGILSLGILERKFIDYEMKQEHCMKCGHFEKEDNCIGNKGSSRIRAFFKMEVFVKGHQGPSQTSKMESCKK